MPHPAICIIGGGIGGVATAVALAKFGIRADVYERAPRLLEVGSGLSLWPNATRALQEMGLLDEVAARSGTSTNFLVRRSDGRVLMNLGVGVFDVPALCTHRADLLDIMLARLPDAQIHLGHELSGLDVTAAKPVVRFKNGVEREYDAVVGADGIRSRVRTKLFGESEPTFRGYMICRGVGHYHGAKMPPLHHSETWGSGGRFGILTMGQARYTWYGTANLRSRRLPNAWSDDPQLRKRELLDAFSNWHEPIPQLIASTPAESILKHGAYDRAPLKRWGKGAITLLGDAAHPLTPNLGQGSCMAIEDALTLAKCVARHDSIPAAFREYEAHRAPRTRHLTERSLLLGWIGQWENPALVAMRQRVTGILPSKLFEYNLKRVYSYQV